MFNSGQRGARPCTAAREGTDLALDPEKKKRTLTYRWLIFAVFALAYFFVYFHRTTGGSISETLEDYYGVGTASVALLASAYLYAYTLMQIPSGVLTDRMGPRKAVSVFVLLIALGSLVSAYSATVGDFNLMILGKFVIGVGAAVVTIPALKILAVWFRRNEFASMNGVLLLVGNVGGIAAAAPMVAMMDSVGIQNTYIVLAVVTAAIALLTWAVVRNHPSEMGLPGIEEIVAEETGEPATESAASRMGTAEALKEILLSGRRFWPLAAWFFLFYGTLMLWQASQAGSYYENVYGFSSSDAALMVTMVGVGMAVGCPLAGVLSDRVLGSRRRVVLIGSIGYTADWAVIWLTAGNEAMSGFAVQAVINLLFGLFGGCFVPSYAQIKELHPVAMAGTASATLNLFPFAGGALMITAAGFLVTGKTLADYQGLWMVAFLMMAVACVCAFLSVEKRADGA